MPECAHRADPRRRRHASAGPRARAARRVPRADRPPHGPGRRDPRGLRRRLRPRGRLAGADRAAGGDRRRRRRSRGVARAAAAPRRWRAARPRSTTPSRPPDLATLIARLEASDWGARGAEGRSRASRRSPWPARWSWSAPRAREPGVEAALTPRVPLHRAQPRRRRPAGGHPRAGHRQGPPARSGATRIDGVPPAQVAAMLAPLGADDWPCRRPDPRGNDMEIGFIGLGNMGAPMAAQPRAPPATR